jgi:hypothetical protein
VYHGLWGNAPFQYRSRDGVHPLQMLPTVPEWYLVLGILFSLTILGVFWTPLRLTAPILAVGLIFSTLHAFMASRSSSYRPALTARHLRLGRRGLTMWLHLLQPLARLAGRLGAGLTPWRRAPASGFVMPRPRTMKFWLERRQASEAVVQSLEASLLTQGAGVSRGGDYDRWDLEARGGLFGTVRIFALVEDHGAGRQLVRIRLLPRWSIGAAFGTAFSIVLAFAAGRDGAWIAAAALGAAAGVLALRAVYDSATTTAAALRAVDAALSERT